MDINQFTPAQRRLLEILVDGLPHTQEELRQCLDQYTSPDVIRVQFTKMRKILQPGGHDIFSRTAAGKETVYQLVRLLASPYQK